MDDESAEFEYTWKDYGQIIFRRRWWLLLPVFAAWGLVSITMVFIPKTYRSETMILIEAPKIPESYVPPNVSGDIQERLQSMSQQILSRTRLLRVIEECRPYGKDIALLPPDSLIERMRKDIQIDLVQEAGRRDVTAFKIFYTARSPQVAQRVTGELTRLFIDENLRTRQEQSENTTAFLETQLQQAREGLNLQEARVRDFKSRYPGQLPNELQPNLQILAGLQTQLQGSLEALNRAKQQNLYYKSMLAQYHSIQVGMRTGSPSAELPPTLDRELSRLKTELADLSAHYTDKHPDVRKLKEQIASAERMRAEIAQRVPPAAGTSVPPTETDGPTAPAVMEIESQLKANEMDIANRQHEVNRLSAAVTSYQGRLNEIPVREQQLADLTRDYDQSRTNYESLLAKRNQSEMATNLEKRQQGEQFRVLDPPSLPARPYWPDPIKFSLGALGIGLVLGLVAVKAAEAMDDRIYSETQFKQVLPVPLLGSLPHVPLPREERRRRLRFALEWVAAGSATVMIAFTLLATYSQH